MNQKPTLAPSTDQFNWPEFVVADFEKLVIFLKALRDRDLRVVILNALYHSGDDGLKNVARVLSAILKQEKFEPNQKTVTPYDFLHDQKFIEDIISRQIGLLLSFIWSYKEIPPLKVFFQRSELGKIMVYFSETSRIIFEREVLGLPLPLSEHQPTGGKAKLIQGEKLGTYVLISDKDHQKLEE